MSEVGLVAGDVFHFQGRRWVVQWTAEKIEERLREAATTLKAMPSDKPMGHRVMWPGVPKDTRDAMLAYGYYGDPENRYRKEREQPDMKVLPSSADIDQLDEALGWLMLLGIPDRKLVSGYAAGVRPAAICRKLRLKVHRNTIRNRFQWCCRYIAARLNT